MHSEAKAWVRPQMAWPENHSRNPGSAAGADPIKGKLEAARDADKTAGEKIKDGADSVADRAGDAARARGQAAKDAGQKLKDKSGARPATVPRGSLVTERAAVHLRVTSD
jgi:hypothetical protein